MHHQKISFINRMGIAAKFLISIVVSIAAYFFVPFKPALHLIFCWDIFCLTLLVLIWITFYTTTIEAIRIESQKEATGRIIVLFITLLATVLSMFAVIQVIVSAAHGNRGDKVFNLAFGMICLVLSWCLVQTLFTSRYAHIYYAEDEKDNETEGGGLDFPGKEHPDFIDFAYFAFTIGMTFQVSDVEISSRKIRRVALLHGLFSFAFNALVIALSVNVISGLV